MQFSLSLSLPSGMFGVLEEGGTEAALGADRPGSGSCSGHFGWGHLTWMQLDNYALRSVRFVRLHFLIFREKWNLLEKRSMPFEVVRETIFCICV